MFWTRLLGAHVCRVEKGMKCDGDIQAAIIMMLLLKYIPSIIQFPTYSLEWLVEKALMYTCFTPSHVSRSDRLGTCFENAQERRRKTT